MKFKMNKSEFIEHISRFSHYGLNMLRLELMPLGLGLMFKNSAQELCIISNMENYNDYFDWMIEYKNQRGVE